MENLQGTTLGRYQLDALLGRGNRASVYQATSQASGTAVTVRVFDRELTAEPQFVERFRQHAGGLAAIRHPNLLPVIDHDEYGGRAFLVRPYMAGGALRRLLGTPLSVAEALRLLRPIAAGLDHAHAQGFIHGDVKPGHILLPGSGDVVLADLGIAELLPRGNSLLMAATGRSYGTPEYLSPEQAHALTLDGRTDQYSLGVILYEALVGRPPFRAEGPADTPRTIAARHITAPPPSPRSLNPAIHPGVERALLRALDKDPLRRFPSCVAFLTAVAEADPLDTTPVGVLALPGAVSALSPAELLESVFQPQSDTAQFELEADTASLPPEPISPGFGTILLPARVAGSGPLDEEAGDPLERLAAHHAAEIQVLTTFYENQLAAQAATLHEQEGSIAALSRQLAESKEKQEQLIAEVVALRREREALRSGERPNTSAPPEPWAAGPTGARVSGQLILLDPQLYNLPHGASFTLTPGATIGRHPDSAILLDDAYVSTHHARLMRESDGWWVTDLGTKNGTFVNGVSITAPTRLNPGDVLRFGRVRASIT